MQFFRFSVTIEPHRFLRSVHYHGLFCNNITEFYMFNKNRTFINYPLSYHMYMFIRYVCFYLMILFQYLHWACKDFFSKVGFWVVQGVWLLTYIINAPLAFICDTFDLVRIFPQYCKWSNVLVVVVVVVGMFFGE